MLRFFRKLVHEIVHDDILDLGAMLAYYAVLALFPMLLFVVSLALLVLPHGVLETGIQMAGEAVPAGARSILVDRAHALVEATNSGFAITGAILALWGASRGAAALGTALNKLFEVEETRSWIKRQLIAVTVTLVVAAMMLGALALLVAGPFAAHWIGLGEQFDVIWDIARYIGAGLLVLVVWGIAYRFLPNTKRPFRVFSAGGIVGVILWLAASWGFGVYLGHAGSYEATYGTLGGAIVFLTWLWLSNLALLIGAEINDVLAYTRGDAESVASLPSIRGNGVPERGHGPGGGLRPASGRRPDRGVRSGEQHHPVP